jgi:simple sugar transport system substrate-binding protein
MQKPNFMEEKPMIRKVLLLLMVLMVFVGAAVPGWVIAQEDEFVFGMIHVGPINDGGWTQAHHEGALYAEEQNPGSRMIYFQSLNPADSPGVTLMDVTTDMVDRGVSLIITTSDAFEEDTIVVAQAFPEVTFINISGDDAATGEAPPNMGNFTSQLLIPRMIAGCAAALTTESGQIGMVGPLINFETMRDQSSAYLGARHCWENYREMDSSELTFTVTWIGFWFHIPGVTLDPAAVTQEFLDSGVDVIINGIDTLEPLEVTASAFANGEDVHFIGTDSHLVCENADPAEVCLGTQFYGWHSLYDETVASAMDGTWEPSFVWYGPNYDAISDPVASATGFVYGEGLSPESRAALDEFIAYLAENTGENTLPLWQGPLNYQDGTELVAEGYLPAFQLQEDGPSVWYLEQLLQGMIGASE